VEFWNGVARNGDLNTGSCGCTGKKKMKVEVLGFLGIRGIIGFLKNNKVNLVFA